MGLVIKEFLSTIIVGASDQLLNEVDVGFSSFKVATAAKQQGLIDAIFQMSVGRFHVAVLIGAACVCSLRNAVVVTHQRRIPVCQFAPTRVISHSSSQRITAMTLRDTSEFPERFLNAGTERFKRFGKTERHTFDITVRQHAVEKRVIKSLSGYLDAQFIAHGEVTGGQSSGLMLLVKEDRLTRTMQTPPPVDAPLKRSTCRIRKLPVLSLLQPLKQCPGFEPRFLLKSFLNLVPDPFERIYASAVVPLARSL